jgi:hypothetical protein
VFDSINETDASDTPTPVVIMPGPYAEEHNALSLPASTLPEPDGRNTGNFLRARAPLDQTKDLTVQMWAKQRTKVPLYDQAYLFSDTDYDLGGGLDVALFVPDPPDPPQVFARTCTDPDAPAFTVSLGSYPNDGMAWHFVRVVHTGGMMNVCVDGKKVASAAADANQLKSLSLPHLGKSGKWLPVGAFFDGLIDDVRVITSALPCGE